MYCNQCLLFLETIYQHYNSGLQTWQFETTALQAENNVSSQVEGEYTSFESIAIPDKSVVYSRYSQLLERHLKDIKGGLCSKQYNVTVTPFQCFYRNCYPLSLYSGCHSLVESSFYSSVFAYFINMSINLLRKELEIEGKWRKEMQQRLIWEKTCDMRTFFLPFTTF